MTLRRRMNNPEKFTLRELFTISEVLGVKFIAGLTSAHTDSENTLTMVLRYIQAVELHPKVGPLTDRQLVEKQELAHWQRKLAEEINSQDTQ